MPSSIWAVSGLSEILCGRTSDSQRVLTKVVRPVPDAPTRELCLEGKTGYDVAYVPTTMRVNWTPFLAFLRPPRRVAIVFDGVEVIELSKLVTGRAR